MEHGVQNKLWALAENIARTVETPEHRKKRQKAAEAAAEAVAEAGASSDGGLTGADRKQASLFQGPTAEGEPPSSEPKGQAREPIVLEAGEELDKLAATCVGAISLMLRSQEATDALAGPDIHYGLQVLVELATVPQGR